MEKTDTKTKPTRSVNALQDEATKPQGLVDALWVIQQELNAPRNQFNKFGNYNYRSCEDILEAVKPLLKKTNTTLTITDKPLLVGDWVFIEATATLIDNEGRQWRASASARHADSQAGMSAGQLTGSTSSYARKYALNGLFAIDDAKDDDTRDNTPSAKNVSQTAPSASTEASKNTFREKVDALKAHRSEEAKTCPECGGDLVLKDGKYGQFWGCSNYPSCTHIEKVKA